MKETIQKATITLKKVPLYAWLIATGVVLIAAYCLVFFIPKPVQFSYAETTCVSQLVVAPGVQVTSSDTFDVSIQNELRVGNWAYAATKLCFTPRATIPAGEYTAAVSPWGGVVAKKQFTIKTPEVPGVAANALEAKKVSTVLPLRIKLESPDIIHRYSLKVAETSVVCQQDTGELNCPVTDLKLKQGAPYTLSFYRGLNSTQAPTRVIETKVETLLPLKQTDATLKDGQTLYDTTKSFTFTFDKPVKEANLTLKKDDGTAIETTVKREGATVTLEAKEDLPRRAQLKVTLEQVVAEDGSSLEAAPTISFSTSGGPKVAAVSVGANKVPQSARIILTFDQPIHESVDMSKVTRATGVPASVQKLSPTQVAVTLQNAPLCAGFILTFDKGVKSGSNNETSDAAWSFSSRTVCGYAATIGSSVRGRPIVAHYFGNGNKTILVTAAIHGSEPSSYYTAQALVDYLYANGHNIPADKRVVVVPNVNPDGIASGARYNANNVNLDRNFPSSTWKPDIETASGIVKNGGGTSAVSEPETRAIYNLTLQLRPWLAVSYHAQGSLVGANQVGHSVSAGNTYARTVGYGTMFGNAEEVMGYPITGEYEEWMGEIGIAAILIELPRHSGNYGSSQLPAFLKLLSL